MLIVGFPADDTATPDVMAIAPYQQENVRRFGDFVYDLTAPLETIEARLDIDDDDETGEGDRSGPGTDLEGGDIGTSNHGLNDLA